MNILVTGGAGYIGSHAPRKLIEAVPPGIPFFHCDLRHFRREDVRRTGTTGDEKPKSRILQTPIHLLECTSLVE